MEYSNISFIDHGDFYEGVLRASKENLLFDSNNAFKRVNVALPDLIDVSSMYMANGLGLRLTKKDGTIILFSGFTNDGIEKLNNFIKQKRGNGIQQIDKCLSGRNDGVLLIPNDGAIIEMVHDNNVIFDIPLESVSNVTTGKNEIGLIFYSTEKNPVSLTEIRFHIDPNSNPDRNTDILSRELTEILTERSDIAATSNDLLVEFDGVACLVPRGKYNMKLFDSHFQLYGKSYDFKIPYRSIVRLFLIPNNDGNFRYFVINTDPPLRHGQTRHPYIVIHIDNNAEETFELNFKLENNKKLSNQIMASLEGQCKIDGSRVSGKTYKIIPRIISEISTKKLIHAKHYKSFKKTSAFICSHKASTGLLFPLDNGFLYVYKPTIYIRNEEISGIFFKRGTDGSRTFDVEFMLKSGVNVSFSSIEKEEYNAFYDHMSDKRIVIRNTTVSKNTEAIVDDSSDTPKQTASGDDDSESNDEDFNPDADIAPGPDEEGSYSSSESESTDNADDDDASPEVLTSDGSE